MRKKRKFQMEKYSPVEEWVEAPSRFTNLPLNDGEYTVIIDPHTGMGLYLVARQKNVIRYCTYLDNRHFDGPFKKVTPLELHERVKENEKFL